MIEEKEIEKAANESCLGYSTSHKDSFKEGVDWVLNRLKNRSMPDVFIHSYIDQTKYRLIGYQAYYEDGSNKFHNEMEDIENGTLSNPLVRIEQVGKIY